MFYKKTVLFLCLSLVSALPVSAETQSDILYDKVERLEKDVMTIQRKIYRGEVGSSTGSSATVTGSAGSLDDLYAQIDEQKNVIQTLTAKVDTLEYNQKQLEERLNKMNTDIDVRFNMVGQKTSAGATASATSGNGDSKLSAKEAYNRAYKIMEKGDYQTAEKEFTAFMRDYPKSDLVGNANYWLGETYYARQLYEQAAGIFADGFTKYKNNTKAPDNLLKLGLTMNNLGKKQDACTAFKSLPTEFPKASQTLKNRAKAEAKKLNCK